MGLDGTWSNTGSLSASSGATLNLGGTFTTDSLSSITNATTLDNATINIGYSAGYYSFLENNPNWRAGRR